MRHTNLWNEITEETKPDTPWFSTHPLTIASIIAGLVAALTFILWAGAVADTLIGIIEMV